MIAEKVDKFGEARFRANDWDHLEVPGWEDIPKPKRSYENIATIKAVSILEQYSKNLDEIWKKLHSSYERNKQLRLMDESKKVIRYLKAR